MKSIIQVGQPADLCFGLLVAGALVDGFLVTGGWMLVGHLEFFQVYEFSKIASPQSQ